MTTIYNLRFWAFGGWFTFAAAGTFIAANASWLVPTATAAAGAATSAYGANKQSHDARAANAANQAAIDRANQQEWQNYLMQRGLNAPGAAYGTIPSNATPVNTRLPLWATFKPAAAQPNAPLFIKG